MVKASVEKETPKKARVVKKKVEVAPPVPEATASVEAPAAPVEAVEAESTLNDQFNEFMWEQPA